MSKGNLNSYRKIAFWEGISYLVLLPLSAWKILLDGPELPVKILGNVHGFLFILYLIFMFIVGSKYKWGAMMYVIALIAAIIPFGTFVYEKKFLKPLSEK
jgi:integral membrane protein